MAPNDEDERETNKETDHMRTFLFGPGRRREAPEDSINELESIDIEDDHFSTRQNRMDDWLFGTQKRRSGTSNHHSNHQLDKINGIDFMEIMKTYDMFLETKEQFKPVFETVTPYIKQLINKFTSKKDGKKGED